MKLTRNVLRLLWAGVFIVVLIAAFVPVLLEVKDDSLRIRLDEVSGPAREVILKETGQGSIRKIELKTSEELTVYDVEIVNGGRKIELEVASDGEILEREEED